jgi:RNA polymerase sigma-70 factor (ECF subfamily)
MVSDSRPSLRPRRRQPRGADAGLSDIELFRRIAAGSEGAFRMLWLRYGPAVQALCRSVLHEPQAAEDATQEAFLRVWRAAGAVDPARGAPSAWLFAVARNSALNIARQRVATPVHDHESGRGEQDGARTLVDRFWLAGALSRLPEDERAAIELAYFADLSHSQVAARLGEPLGTVKSRIRRALGRLADLMEER